MLFLKMIKVKDLVLKHTEGKWERFKVRHGLTQLPATYICRNLQELVNERNSVEVGATILLPRLVYFSNGEELLQATPIILQDESAKVDAVYNSYMVNHQTGRVLREDIGEVCEGETVFTPVIMNGHNWPYQKPDSRIYLTAFGIRRNADIRYSPSLGQTLSELAGKLAPKVGLCPVPVRR